MSLQTQLAALITRIGTEFKAVRLVIGSLSELATGAKTSVVEAINELHDVQASLSPVALSGQYGDLDGVPAATSVTDKLLVDPSLTRAVNAETGEVTIGLNSPGNSFVNFGARILVEQNADGTWPPLPPYPKECAGKTMPAPGTAGLLSGRDIGTVLPGGATPVPDVIINLPSTALSTNSWSWTLPTGFKDNQRAFIAIQFATYSASHTYTFKIDGVTIPTSTLSSGASGFTTHYYVFDTLASMSGKVAAMTATTTATLPSVRAIGIGASFTNILSKTPSGSARSGVSGSVGSTGTSSRTTPNATITPGFHIELSIVSVVSSTATAPANLIPPTGVTKVTESYHTSSTAYQAMAMGWRLPSTSATSAGAATWTTRDAANANTGGYGASSTIVLPLASSAPARQVYVDNAWSTMPS